MPEWTPVPGNRENRDISISPDISPNSSSYSAFSAGGHPGSSHSVASSHGEVGAFAAAAAAAAVNQAAAAAVNQAAAAAIRQPSNDLARSLPSRGTEDAVHQYTPPASKLSAGERSPARMSDGARALFMPVASPKAVAPVPTSNTAPTVSREASGEATPFGRGPAAPILAPVIPAAARKTSRVSHPPAMGTPARSGARGGAGKTPKKSRKDTTKTPKRDKSSSRSKSATGGSGASAGSPAEPVSPALAASAARRTGAAAPKGRADEERTSAVEGKRAESKTDDAGGPKPTGQLPRRLLQVEVVEAAGLLGTSSRGSNPKCLLSLVDLAGRQIKVEKDRQSEVISNTVSPVWKFKTTFGQRYNLSQTSAGNLPTLRVQVVSFQRLGTDIPLGVVDIPLVHLSAQGQKWEQWYELEPFGKLKAGSRFGSIHLRLEIGPVVRRGGDVLTVDTTSFNDRPIEACGDEEEKYRMFDPNCLRVTLHQAHDLRAEDFATNSSDPMAMLRVGETTRRSKTISENLYPKWEETFDFPCTSSGETLEITIVDVDPLRNEFLGFVSILMSDLADKKKIKQWFELTLKSGELPPGEERGAVEVTTQWFYNPAMATHHHEKRSTGIFNTLIHKHSDTEDEMDAEHDPNKQLHPQESEDPDAVQRREAAANAERELLQKLREFKVVSGDYVAYVHIIEARDLKGEDLQGTSDPIVYVEAFGQKFATEVQFNKLNAVFDETFVISLRNLDQDDFKEGIFRVSVMDADGTFGPSGPVKADLIGAVSFDATYVYFSKDHEIHRRWVALVDDLNPDDVGIQGYLQLSIAVVGPDDRLKQHDEEADRRKERAVEEASGGVDSLVVMPPTLELRQKWLVTTVAKAEYLPVMDLNVVGGAGGGDFFFQVEVGGGKPFRTKQITIRGERHKLNPEWRTELWNPVTVPCMSGNIKYSVWDWDLYGKNERVGTFYSRLRDIEAKMESRVNPSTARWVNLYGPPVHVPETENVRRLTKRAAALGTGTDYMEQYLTFPQLGSTYRGRVLISEKVVDQPPQQHLKDKTAWRRKIKTSRVPASEQYVLRAFIGSGTEIPKFTDISFVGTRKMWIRVSVGRYELATQPVDNVHGICEWYQSLQLKSNFTLPSDSEQVPDLIIHLMVGTGTSSLPCSFRRFKASELIDAQFGGQPQWFNLKEDKVLDLLETNEFPGSVLVRLGFGRAATYSKLKDKWEEEIQGLLKREAYELRVHLYQARNLPAADNNGLMDPYLNVKFAGEEISTENIKELRRRETVDPVWYHTLQMKAKLPPIKYQKYFPQVSIQLFDWDFGFVNDYAGHLFLMLSDLKIFEADRRTTQNDIPEPPTPQWVPFFMETPGDGQGELLVSLQLIHNKAETLPPPPKINPEKRQAYLDMVILGIRNMQPYHYLPIQLPYCVFEVDDMDGTKRTAQTEPSSKPSGSDANFLQHVKMRLSLPLDVIYSPRVKVRVYDTRLGGFRTPLVGAGRIDLTKKLPWSPVYEPPLAKIFARDQLLQAVGADMESEGEEGEMKTTEGEGEDNIPSSGETRSGRASSAPGNKSVRGFGDGVVWGSGSMHLDSDVGDDDDDSSAFGGTDGDNTAARGAFGNVGQSGFGAGGAYGGASQRRAISGSTRGGRRKVYTPHNTGSMRLRSTTEFGGGGGGALGVMQERTWRRAADNEPVKSATGEVIDTGIGIMPALDLARQRSNIPTSSEAAAAAAAGAAGVAAAMAGAWSNGLSPVVSAGEGADGVGGIADSMSSAGLGKRGRATADHDNFYAHENDEPDDKKYMFKRETLEGSLEEELESTPFETYELFRGQTLGLNPLASLGSLLSGTSNQVIGGVGTLKVVGKLKCIVRVTEGDPDNEPLFVEKKRFDSLEKAVLEDKRILNELLKPRSYKVRLYALEASNLTPMDVGFAGRPGKSDPYLKVKLGKQVFDDKENYIDDVTDADLYKCVELGCELPGAGQLQIDVMDYDDIGRDDLIGRTVIDLEDRWFDTRWQAWGLPNRCEDMGKRRWQTKPVEIRVLKVPTSLAAQGRLRCWLDLMPPEDAKAFPPDDVAPPPNHEFEVRVVFWKCKNVVAMDNFTDQNDLYVKSWVEGCDPQQTDIHWFSKKGRASFNWRMKFKVSLGPKTRASKFPYLTVQMWDKDILKWDDNIAEGLLDLGPHFEKAYKTREVVRLFQDPKLLEKKRVIAEAELANMEIDQRRGRPGEGDGESLVANMDRGGNGDGPPSYEQMVAEAFESPVEGTPVRSGRNGRHQATVSDDALPQRRPSKAQRSCLASCCRSFCCCGARKAMKKAPVTSGEDSDEEAKADAKAFISSIKAFTGIGEDDPDESYWLRMEKTNMKTRKKQPMGQCLMGVQIWPIEKAELQQVGFGRNDPNIEPFLPPPAGRLRFSLNPFVMGTELFGAKICCRIYCVICIILVILFFVYLSPILNLLYNVVDGVCGAVSC